MPKLFTIVVAVFGVLACVCTTGCEGCGCGGWDAGLIAKLDKVSGSVERDYAAEIGRWIPSEKGARFRLGDGVRTLAESGAVLKLSGDAELHVKESTQIRFLDDAPKPGSLGVKLESGEAELVAGIGELELVTDLGTAVLNSGTRVTLAKSETGFDMRVEVGAATLFREGRPPEEMLPGEEVELFIGDVELMPLSSKTGEPADAGSDSPRVKVPTEAEVTGTGEAPATLERYEKGPGYADMGATAGDSLSVHAARLPVVVAFDARALCPSRVGISLAGKKGGVSGVGVVNVPFGRGLNRYVVYCLENGTRSKKPEGKGRILVIRDSGRTKIPKKAPASSVETDGRRYKILYQNRKPVVTVRWGKAPEASSYTLMVEYASGKRAAIPVERAEHRFPSGKFAEGTHKVRFLADGTSWKSKQTTVHVKFDNAAPKASWNHPVAGSFGSSQTVVVSGVAVPGWKVSAEGVALELDEQNRFSGSILYSGKYRGIVLRLVHPKRGVHYYLRRGAGEAG